ncbi:hypothetical protein PILCRDRAFT_816721 [Piloderma croceum F 1598]|uniref:Uncharacterized protein n=1 Tax=Piloderma croceum (strain F 1598) TaxID=765440 RepID=A0A0C3BIP0_PILCF|nr:hypothetical protein PILCRDRAFT_816721 [Piloderma croceum F 1598]
MPFDHAPFMTTPLVYIRVTECNWQEHRINDFFGKLNKSKAVTNRLIVNEGPSGSGCDFDLRLDVFIDTQANIEAMTAGCRRP